MKLSPDQITLLKKLISHKGYEEIDVQYEILDHVACRMEILIEENPKLALEDAFRKAHSEFGIFGFADLADSYRESIRKKFWSRYWSSMRSFFTSYRIVYLVLLTWALGYSSKNLTLFGEAMTTPGWGVIGLMISVVFLVIYYHRVGRKFKNYATFKHSTNFFFGLNLIIQFCLQGGGKFLKGYEIPIEISFETVLVWIITITLIIGWISIFLLPKIIQEAAEETQKLKIIYEG